MSNPNPKTENLKSFQRASDRELGRVVGTRYPLDVAEALGKVGNHQDYIRAAVEEKLKADKLLPSGDDAA
ncbi:hypothetical protein [Stenomitos frigidus]|uniref:Uncharacterized protein n=1 Tax=Stenomitos frigidus ULC18 TaxID=2107698 RepID=A0A2T1EBN8_9CYAN|nr:hypothetical protein [Stenomitos frigidus]PSB30159.1 hypothetical protein C7B82_09390 [Stenomitos frigidus ULC18]